MNLLGRRTVAGMALLAALPFVPSPAHAAADFGRCVYPRAAANQRLGTNFVSPGSDTVAWSQRCWIADMDGNVIEGTEVECAGGPVPNGCARPVADVFEVNLTYLSCVSRVSVKLLPPRVEAYADCTVVTPVGTFLTEN